MVGKKTSPHVASKASKILSNPKSTPTAKKVAASDLAQAKPNKSTSASVASKASKELSSSKTTATQKKVAASTLAQKVKSKSAAPKQK